MNLKNIWHRNISDTNAFNAIKILNTKIKPKTMNVFRKLNTFLVVLKRIHTVKNANKILFAGNVSAISNVII